MLKATGPQDLVIQMKSAAVSNTTLLKFFDHCSPDLAFCTSYIVSDNGSLLFINNSVVEWTQSPLVAPYHPSSNGEAEKFIQTFKVRLDTRDFMCNFCRRIPHPVMGKTPAELICLSEQKARRSVWVRNQIPGIVLKFESEQRVKTQNLTEGMLINWWNEQWKTMMVMT